jgi:hypothetical protein
MAKSLSLTNFVDFFVVLSASWRYFDFIATLLLYYCCCIFFSYPLYFFLCFLFLS